MKKSGDALSGKTPCGTTGTIPRRQLLICGGMAAFSLVACSEPQRQSRSRLVDLGPEAQFQEGVTDLPLQRLRILRRGDSFWAIQMVCTHQECVLKPLGNGYECPCHGSVFDSRGRVVQGPAAVDLPWFETFVRDSHLMVDLKQPSKAPELA